MNAVHTSRDLKRGTPRVPTICAVGIAFVIAGFTILQRFGINLGLTSVDLSLIAEYGLLSILLFSGILNVNLGSCRIFFACVLVGNASLLFNLEAASITSILLLNVIYLPFIFVIEPDVSTYFLCRWTMSAFSNLALLCAVCGILQFATQPFVHYDWIYDFSSYIPEFIRSVGVVNTVIPVGSLIKSNGFFFREPSGFSQTMALALICEITIFKRVPRIVALAAALLLSYSGTGLAVLVIATLFPFGYKTVVRILGFTLIGALIYLCLGSVLDLSFTLGRLAEFDEQSSSGFARFVAPAYFVIRELNTENWTVFFGHGPGTILHTIGQIESAQTPIHDPTWAKLIFEYGILGFLAYISLVVSALSHSSAPIQLRAALFFSWLIMGGHLLAPEKTTEMYILAVLFVGARTPAGVPSESSTAQMKRVYSTQIVQPSSSKIGTFNV